MKKLLITCTAIACLGLALAASRHGESVTNDLTVRIDDALHALEQVHVDIPHAALHAKALEILQSRIVAKDDGDESKLARDLGTNDLDRIEKCVTYNRFTMDKVNCMK